MDEDAFWQLIEDCRPTEPDPDAELLAATLTERLARSPLSLVIGFAEQLSWALYRPSLLTPSTSSGPSPSSTHRTGHTSALQGRNGAAIPATPTNPAPTLRAGVIEHHGLQAVTNSRVGDRPHGMCARTCF
ncbi:DUF4240 domain-containing protein [Streptomyces sp. WM6372]|uniref:DUF4240 domain-containing protein n=1 Tax=Streptomyces sp. WM6372 TaxID=1415555 RepID=UPI003B63D408